MNHTVTVRVNPDPSDPYKKWAVFVEPNSTYCWTSYPDGDFLTNEQVSGWTKHQMTVPSPKREFKPGDLVEVKTGYYPCRAVRMDDYWWAPFDERCLGKDSFLDGEEYIYIGNTLEMS